MPFSLEEFLMFPEEVLRIGNNTTPRLNAVRPTEIDTITIQGIKVVIANGKGVSLYRLDKLLQIGLTGYAWRFNQDSLVVHGLKLVNDKPGHYMLAPAVNMPLDKYKGLLEEMGMKCCKYIRVKEGGAIEKL